MNGLGYYLSPLGDLMITSRDDKVTGVQFVTGERSDINETPVVRQCIAELDEYFLRGRKFFDVEVQFFGSTFQNKVWPNVQDRYVKVLDWALDRPRAMLWSTVGLLIFTIVLMGIVPPKVVFFPTGDPNFVYVYVSLPVGTDQAYTNEVIKKGTFFSRQTFVCFSERGFER